MEIKNVHVLKGLSPKQRLLVDKLLLYIPLNMIFAANLWFFHAPWTTIIGASGVFCIVLTGIYIEGNFSFYTIYLEDEKFKGEKIIVSLAAILEAIWFLIM